MSDNHSNDIEHTDSSWELKRRRLLQAAGVGIGGLSLAGFTGSIAAAKTGCANGPFEGSYESGTVNVGQIRAAQAQGDEPGPDIGAATPRSGAADGDGEQPPRLAAQESTADRDGPLTITTEYDGVNSQETRGGVPSDSQIAVGNGKAVHALNRNVAIYNKESGRREQFFLLEDLWKPVIDEPDGGFVFDTPFVFDPRARYDPAVDRFILCAVQFQFGLTGDGEIIDREAVEEAAEEGDEEAISTASRPPRGWLLVAVSATGNPNGDWYVYRVPPEDANGVDNIGLVDYPTLGYDKDAVYLTQNFFSAEFDVTMVALDKDAMYAGETTTGYHFDGMHDADADGITFTVQPGQQPYSGGQSGTFYLVNSDFPYPGPSSTLTLWELTSPLDDPSLECFTLDVDAYSYPPNAEQPGTDALVDTLGTRVMNADFHDGSLWTAHSLKYDWGDGNTVAAIKWYEIGVAEREVVQSGVYGEPGTSYFMPTVGTNGDATIITHNVSGPETFVRMDVTGRTADHTLGEMEDSIVVEHGKSPYNALAPRYGSVERWGDYNGISVDPVTGNFWTVSQYSPDIDIPEDDPERDPYYTRIAAVSFDE